MMQIRLCQFGMGIAGKALRLVVLTSLDKVVYVDATNGNDSNEGHRHSPKKTIKAAITQINADATHGDGSVAAVAPGVYQTDSTRNVTLLLLVNQYVSV